MKTITEIRKAFWEYHPKYKHNYRKTWRQNRYPTDIRVLFIDYVDFLAKNGDITEKLARRVTL